MLPLAPLTRKEQKQTYENNKLAKKLRAKVQDAVRDYGMIEAGDRIMVCLSGGKDSYGLLDLLLSLQRNFDVPFSVVAVNLDQKQPGFPAEVLPAYLEKIGVEYKIIERDTYSIVQRLIAPGDTTCSLCSRLRRGHLYTAAKELGCTKIALGHHRDDILETLFLNMFYGGRLKAMAPKLVSDNGEHMVIRPLAYCRESDLEKLAELRQFPIIPCNLCGSQPNLQRKVIKDMLQSWEKQHPGRLDNVFRSLKTVVPEHLADTGLFDFSSLKTDGQSRPEQDLGLDE